MNFLLHRQLALRDRTERAAGIGAMLPDLWRMADRRARPSRVRPTRRATDDDSRLEAMLDGVAHHLAADAWFHRQPVFERGETRTAERFASLEMPRTRLFAHVAWELALDGAWLRGVGTEGVLAALRHDVETFRETVRAAGEAHGIYRRVDDEGKLDSRLGRLLTDLTESDWLPGYTHGAGLAARLSGVRRRVGLEPFDAEAQARIAAELDPTLDDAERALPALLDSEPIPFG